MKAYLPNYRQSPRKVRLVARAVSGKKVVDAVTILSFMPKRAAEPIMKLINSAVANSGLSREELVVKNIEVNKGLVMKRSMPRARGSAFPINKRTSHVLVTLVAKNASAAVVAPVETPKNSVKKPAAKKAPVKKTAVSPSKKVMAGKAVKKKSE